MSKLKTARQGSQNSRSPSLNDHPRVPCDADGPSLGCHTSPPRGTTSALPLRDAFSIPLACFEHLWYGGCRTGGRRRGRVRRQAEVHPHGGCPYGSRRPHQSPTLALRGGFSGWAIWGVRVRRPLCACPDLADKEEGRTWLDHEPPDPLLWSPRGFPSVHPEGFAPSKSLSARGLSPAWEAGPLGGAG